MRTKYKPWAKPYIEEHPEVMLTLDQLASFSDFYLEIGSGKGKFLFDMANKFADKKFVGVERNVTCAGFAAKKLVEGEVSNAKLMFENADQILMTLKDKSVDGIFLNFSDPWPKKRHHKRRLTAPQYLLQYARVLKKDALLVIKTDNDDLYQFSLETLAESPFKIIFETFDYKDLDEFDVMTEYEISFRDEGMPIHRIIAKVK